MYKEESILGLEKEVGRLRRQNRLLFLAVACIGGLVAVGWSSVQTLVVDTHRLRVLKQNTSARVAELYSAPNNDGSRLHMYLQPSNNPHVFLEAGPTESGLTLTDAQGKVRIRLVASERATLEFRDKQGKLVARYPE